MKLTPWTVFTIALSLAIVILSVGYFQFWEPNTTEATYQDQLREKLELEANKLPRQRQLVKEAEELTQRAADDWQAVVMRKTPPNSLEAGGVNLAVNRWQLVVDSVRWRNTMQRDLNRQLRVGGVTVISGPTIPHFPDSPTTIVETGYGFPSFKFPVRVYDFGAVTVEGSIAQIRQHVEAWSNMPKYMAVTDGLRIQGTPPRLTATYNLSMVVYYRAKEIFPPVPELPADQANLPTGIGAGGPAAPPPGLGRGGPDGRGEGLEGR